MENRSIKRISWLALVAFIFNLLGIYPGIKVDAKAASNIDVTDSAVLVGNLMEENNLGDNWNPANNKGRLREYKNGIYEGTFKVAKNKKYEYKIAMNGTWEECYGKDGGEENIILETGNEENITFRLDLVNKKVYDSKNNPEQFKTKAILTGAISTCLGGKEWDPSDDNFKMDYIGGGMYEKTFDVKTAGKVQYKTAYNGAWDNGEVSNNNSADIKEGTKEVKFFADYLENDTGDSINNPELLKTVSLLGTVRDDNSWDETSTDYDMYRIDVSKVMYTKELKAGEYEYKAVVNHNSKNGVMPKTGVNKFKLEEDKNVIFIADTKTGELIDSVNDLDKVKEALGLKEKPVEITSPVINNNGTITFNYKNNDASSVYLSSSLNNWSKNATELKKSDDGLWSVTIMPGDEAKEIQYKFIVDGREELDGYNEKTKDGNSVVNFEGFSGRPITLPGSLQTGIDGTSGSWKPDDKAVQLDYIGNGNYKKTFRVKAGRYEFKTAVNYSWDPENYGLNGVDHGNNIPLVVPRDMDVTFYYNDYSHKTLTSLDYKILNVTLYNGSTELCKLTDDLLNGIYSGQVDLKAGTYDDLSLKVSGDENKDVKVDKVVLDKGKTVTFSYDPESELCFNNASNNKINSQGLYYDSRSEEYKNPYGAIEAGTEINFALKADKDMLTEGKFILGTPNGTKVLDMSKAGSFEDGSDKWTVKYTPETIGTYSYYFVVSNGSDVKAYGDDDGFFGTGTIGNLGEIKNYEFNVCTKDFKTPDWLKNGVLYQIYPDRFFNGDLTNDFVQKYARGNTPYEFPTNWYSLPKNPGLMGTEQYPSNANLGSNKDWANDLYGGDLKGIEKKVKYLKALGVTVLYLNPIGQSISSHRYDTTDYSKVDPLLGSMDDFVSLAKAAKENDMHIILDGVFNHVCDDSIYFDKYGKYMSAGKPLGAYQYWQYVYDNMNENGITLEEAESKAVEYYKSIGITDLHYKDWFVIKNEKYLAENGNEYYSYEGWSGYDNMPVIQALDGSEYNVESWASEIIDDDNSIARQWLRNGSNGWRLDVANEVSDETWRAFRKVVKSEGDNAIIGEIWTDASNYILGDMYDSVMNYRFRGAVINYVKGTQDDNVSKVSAKDSMNELEKMREQYPREALEAMMNLVGSHDTQRVISALDGYQKSKHGFAKDPTDMAKAKMKLIPFLQMTYIGAPTIYYGDEIGMAGCDDPDNRRGFTWGRGDKELVEWYSSLAAIRREYSSLRTGDVRPAEVQKEFENDVLAFTRIDSESKILTAANRLENAITTEIKTPGIEDGTKLTNLLNKDEVYTVKDGMVKVNIPAYNGVILADVVKDVKADLEDLKDAYSEDNQVSDRVVPKTDKELINEINTAKDGDGIVISENNDSISLELLKAAKNSGKNIKYVIKRADGKVVITISDIGKLEEMVEKESIPDLRINVSEELENTISDKYIEKFNISSNLKNGNLEKLAEVQVKIDDNYNNKDLYVYVIGSNGDKELVQKAQGKDNMIIFNLKDFGDYIISDEEMKSDSEDGSYSDGTDKPSITDNKDGVNSSKKNPSRDGKKVKTGDSNIIIIMCLMILSAVAFTSIKKKKVN